MTAAGMSNARSPAVIAPLANHATAGSGRLARSEYVRRRLAQDAAAPDATVTAADLARFGELFADLADRDGMDQAWR